MEQKLANLRLLPVYFLYLFTWFITGGSKILGPVPSYFSERFGGTFLAHFPGITVAYYQIALLEVSSGMLFLVSLLRGEFLVNRSRPFLQAGMWFSFLTFAVLGFGLRLVEDHAGAASLFCYFGATAAIYNFVIRPDPRA